jgi:hypothetical protein
LVDTIENKKEEKREQEKYNKRFPGRKAQTTNKKEKSDKKDKK